jgi:hypothetical protein
MPEYLGRLPYGTNYPVRFPHMVVIIAHQPSPGRMLDPSKALSS